MRAIVANAADPEQVRHGARVAKRRQDHRAGLVAWLMGQEAGRAFLWNELERLGVFDQFHGPSDEVFRALGRRDAGLDLMLELQRDQRYVQMVQEAAVRNARQDREVAALHEGSRKDDV